MAETQDILFDESNDVACIAGDFEVGISDDQHVMDLFEASEGHYKQNPITGIGIIKALNGVIDGKLKRIARINLQVDGYKLNSITSPDGENFSIDYTK
jgi:hypothetical protein